MALALRLTAVAARLTQLSAMNQLAKKLALGRCSRQHASTAAPPLSASTASAPAPPVTPGPPHLPDHGVAVGGAAQHSQREGDRGRGSGAGHWWQGDELNAAVSRNWTLIIISLVGWGMIQGVRQARTEEEEATAKQYAAAEQVKAEQAHRAQASVRQTVGTCLERAHRLILSARAGLASAYPYPGTFHSLQSAEEAVATAVNALGDGEEKLHMDRDATLAALGYDKAVAERMYASIHFLTAKGALVGGDIDKATDHLAQADHHRCASNLPTSNELRRISLLAGDIQSAQQHLYAALTCYAVSLKGMPAESRQSWDRLSVGELDSFWATRATTNAAVTYFDSMKDQDAMRLARLVAAATAAWVTKPPVPAVDATPCWHGVPVPAQLGGWYKALRDAVHAIGPMEYSMPADGELDVVNLGAGDAVDLSFLKDVPAAAKVMLTEDDLRQPAGRIMALEYVDRVRLLLRVHFAARAHAVMFACAPFSQARQAHNWDSDLWQLLEELVSPLPAMPVYAELDATWLHEQGVASMLTAAGWALVELLLAGAVCPERETEVAAAARELLGRAARATRATDGVEALVGHIANARLALADHPGGYAAALSKLHVAYQRSCKWLLFSPYQHAPTWLDGGMFTRQPRWHMEIVAMGRDLHRCCGTPDHEGGREALQRAVARVQAPSPHTHPLVTAASCPDTSTNTLAWLWPFGHSAIAQAAPATAPAGANRRDAATVTDLLHRIDKWARGMELPA